MTDHIETAPAFPLPLLGAVAGSVVALLGIGLYLWARNGDVIFTDLVSAALAWCF